MSTTFIEDVRKPGEKEVVEEPLTKKISDTSLGFEVDEYISKFLDLSNDAKANESQEKTMSLMDGLRTFPKAVMWSVILSTALVMEGYDTSLLGSLYGFPAFAKRYGQWYESEKAYIVPAHWQTTLSMCTNLGEIVGLFIAGILADRIGYRKTLIGSLFLVICFIFIPFFSNTIEILLVGEVLLGLPWGAFQTLTVTYASEVCPLVLRIYLTTYVNMCWVFGQLISSGILKGFEGNSATYAYKIPFAIQWIWPIPLAIGIYLAPESPWWLIRKGKDQEAKRSLERLMSEGPNLPKKSILADAMLKKMQITVEAETAKTKNITYWDCFRGTNFRRTRIAALVFVMQTWTGSALMGFSTIFYEQAGLSSSNAFTFNIVQYILGICGVILSWFLSQRFGRFDLYFGGIIVNCCVMFIVGGLGCSNSSGAQWGIGSMLLIFTFVFDTTVGPICYCLIAELPSTILRAKTVVLARNFYNVASIFNAIATPYMVNETAWGWKGKTGFFWGGMCVLSAIYCWFELPETKGKTFAEMDALFESKCKARDFKKAEVDPFDAGRMMEELGQQGIKNFIEKEEHFISEEKV